MWSSKTPAGQPKKISLGPDTQPGTIKVSAGLESGRPLPRWFRQASASGQIAVLPHISQGSVWFLILASFPV